ncbi:MAG: hypothetical protein IJU44_02175 [Kiritimatiellae bacterium]|nr:hypothetical protein [Kiritimatiellia bacterium]
MLKLVFLGLFLCSFFAFADPPDWAHGWAEVERMRKEGKLEEAVTATLELERFAVSNGFWDEVVRAVVTRFALGRDRAPSSWGRQLVTLKRFANEGPRQLSPAIYCHLVSFYEEFYQANPAVFHHRLEPLPDADQNDNPAEWSMLRLTAEIRSLLESALSDSSVLKKMTVADYGHGLRCEPSYSQPTLFDWAAYRSLAWWELAAETGVFGKNILNFDETDLVLADTAKFIGAKFRTASEFADEVLALYQSMLSFHASDKNGAPAAAADLSRLQFVWKHARPMPVPNNGGTLPVVAGAVAPVAGDDRSAFRARYESSLNQFLSKWRSTPVSVQAAAIRGTMAIEDGEPGIAHLILSRSIAGYPDDDVEVRKCRALLSEIERPDFSLSQEGAGLLVEYRNIRELHLRIFPVAEDQTPPHSSDRAALAEWLAKPPAKAWIAQLPPCKDFKRRDFSVKLPLLPNGRYLLAAADNDGFKKAQCCVIERQ